MVPVVTHFGNKFSKLAFRGRFYSFRPAVDEVTDPGGFSEGLEIKFIGFHLFLEVFTAKSADKMFQKIKVQEVPVDT